MHRLGWQGWQGWQGPSKLINLQWPTESDCFFGPEVGPELIRPIRPHKTPTPCLSVYLRTRMSMSSLLNWDLRKRRVCQRHEWTVSWSGHRSWAAANWATLHEGKALKQHRAGYFATTSGTPSHRRGMVRSTLHTVVTVVYVGPGNFPHQRS
jgi:hypothetical protein